MKYLLTVLTALIMAGTTVIAQEKANEPANGPSFNFNKTQHDFGEIDEGPKAKYNFEFTNNGTKPLVITDVRASCGCTTPHWPKKPVKPGETGKIEVVYDTKGRPGRFTKVVTISSNAGSNEKIFIKGNVKKGKGSEDGHDHNHDHEH